MRIGIDIDGVILDYERVVRTQAELYDLLDLNKNGVMYSEELKVQKRYNWTPEEINNFINKYFVSLTKITPFMPFAKEVIELLKKDGHTLILITARGGYTEQMRFVAEAIFEKENLTFDKYYWKIDNKLEICQKEEIDIMIDDFYVTCEEVSKNGIKTLYFRDKGMKKLKENELLIDVSNWGEIYRYIFEMEK